MSSATLLPLLLTCAAMLLASCASSPRVPDGAEPFGALEDGRKAHRFRLESPGGCVAEFTDFGAALVALRLPDRNGDLADVVLGFDDVAGYAGEDNQYFGCTAGRVANRIDGASFELDGKTVNVTANDGEHCLHGGARGFGQRLWSTSSLEGDTERGLRFEYLSGDGEEGFPGNLRVTLDYWLTDANELRLEYSATTDAPTVVNLTHHSYWNLSGAGSETVLDHELQILAERFTEAGEGLIPTGELLSVLGTPLDFREPRRVGERLDALVDTAALGYDHNYVLNSEGAALALAAVLRDPASGRVLEVWTDEPGLQLYSGNFLSGQVGKGGVAYPQRSALCLEPQHFPDSPNQPSFPSIVLEPGETYEKVTVFRFPSPR
jgi:aldose 1-epimerase